MVMEELLRPKTRGELVEALKKNIRCEIVASNEEFTSICLDGALNYEGRYKTYPSKNKGWVIYETRTPEILKQRNLDGKKVLIVGSGGTGLIAARIAELQLEHSNVEIVSLEEAKERGLSQTYDVSAPPLMPLRDDFKAPPTRSERRKKTRKKK